MDNRFTKEQMGLIEKVAKEKNVDTKQFCDFLCGFQGSLLEKAADNFINYCQYDGWYNYERKD